MRGKRRKRGEPKEKGGGNVKEGERVNQFIQKIRLNSNNTKWAWKL